MTDVVQKLWGFCNILRHDGIDYGDYIEQLTYLLFLKMAEEKSLPIPARYSWASLRDRSGNELAEHYVDTLRNLGKERGILGEIFSGALSRFNNPVNLKKLISLIDEIEWTSLGVDVKAHAYEGLLEKAASEGKKGAGQYFTPRILIDSIVRVMKPDPRNKKDFTIHDPAAGTGGFLIEAYEWLIKETEGAMPREIVDRITKHTYSGVELVKRPKVLALMNLYLHGLESKIYLGDSIYEPFSGEQYDCVLTNPPFGTKGANQAPTREDFTISTSNKQLNFIQHILTILKPGGRAAIVVPDNVLFEDKAAEIFEILTKDCDLHTVLRLPNGTFSPYSPGVKANVIFFTKGIQTKKIWIYDARSNVPSITKQDRPLEIKHFKEFERCYGDDPYGRSKRSENERFRSFTLEDIRDRGYHLDVKWIKSDEIDEYSDKDLEGLIDVIKEKERNIHTNVENLQQSINNKKLEKTKKWQVKRLGDLIDLNYGKSLPKNSRKNGDVPVYGSNGIVGSNDKALVNFDTIIVGRKGSVGALNFVKGSSFPIDTTYYITIKKGIALDLKFLYYLLQKYDLKSMDTSTAIPGLNRDDVYELTCLLPPRPIQQVISNKLDIINQKISLIKKDLASQEKVINSLLKAALNDAFNEEV